MHLLVQNMQFLVPAPESSQSKEASTIQGKRRASYREAQRGKKFTLSKQDCVLLKLVHCVICTFQFFFFIINTNIIKMTMTRSASRPCSVCSQIFIKKKKTKNGTSGTSSVNRQDRQRVENRGGRDDPSHHLASRNRPMKHVLFYIKYWFYHFSVTGGTTTLQKGLNKKKQTSNNTVTR